jgi:hypothetical protein
MPLGEGPHLPGLCLTLCSKPNVELRNVFASKNATESQSELTHRRDASLPSDHEPALAPKRLRLLPGGSEGLMAKAFPQRAAPQDSRS